MRRRSLFSLLVAGLLAAAPANAQARPHDTPDSGFAALQERGKATMGVDQHTSTHRFDPAPDGGRIELQRDPADSAGVATIRQHLKAMADMFAAGDFNVPAFNHGREVPGTKVMAEKKDRIRYTYNELPGGGEVVITTSDLEAVEAIHQFLAFQRRDHRVEKRER